MDLLPKIQQDAEEKIAVVITDTPRHRLSGGHFGWDLLFPCSESNIDFLKENKKHAPSAAYIAHILSLLKKIQIPDCTVVSVEHEHDEGRISTIFKSDKLEDLQKNGMVLFKQEQYLEDNVPLRDGLRHRSRTTPYPTIKPRSIQRHLTNVQHERSTILAEKEELRRVLWRNSYNAIMDAIRSKDFNYRIDHVGNKKMIVTRQPMLNAASKGLLINKQ